MHECSLFLPRKTGSMYLISSSLRKANYSFLFHHHRSDDKPCTMLRVFIMITLFMASFCTSLTNCAPVHGMPSTHILDKRISKRDDYIFAQLCSKDGYNCTGKHYLTDPVCFDWTSNTKALRIHASSALSQSSSFTLYTTSIGQTCPDRVIADQYLEKPFDGQLITVTSIGTRFYFVKSF